MKKIFFRIVSFLIKITKVLLFFLTFSILLGVILIVFNQNLIENYLQLENDLVQAINIEQIFIVCFAAIIIQVSIIYLLHMLELLLKNISNSVIFKRENIKILDRMLISLALWTGVQLFTSALLNF